MTKINAIGSNVFRNAKAIMLYDKMRKDNDVYECGIDEYGYIYFAYLNGIVKRYKRRDFLKLAKGND